MTAYATHADVEMYLVDYTVSATSSITDAQIDAICVTEQAEVDGILAAGTGYTLPVTGTGALAIMKKIISLRAAAATWRRLPTRNVDDHTADDWRSEADKMLDDILSGDVKLADAPMEASADISAAPRVTACTEIFTREALDDFVSAHGTST